MSAIKFRKRLTKFKITIALPKKFDSKGFITVITKGKRKVQGVPQSQTAALPRHQEEEETDKSKQAQTEETYEKH